MEIKNTIFLYFGVIIEDADKFGMFSIIFCLCTVVGAINQIINLHFVPYSFRYLTARFVTSGLSSIIDRLFGSTIKYIEIHNLKITWRRTS